MPAVLTYMSRRTAHPCCRNAGRPTPWRCQVGSPCLPLALLRNRGSQNGASRRRESGNVFALIASGASAQRAVVDECSDIMTPMALAMRVTQPDSRGPDCSVRGWAHLHLRLSSCANHKLFSPDRVRLSEFAAWQKYAHRSKCVGIERANAPASRHATAKVQRVDAAPRPCFLVFMYSEALQIEILQATPADVGAVAPLFDAYRQFYKKPSNEEAARRFLFARLSKGESVLFLARQRRSRRLRPPLSGLLVHQPHSPVDPQRPLAVPGRAQARSRSCSDGCARLFAESTQADGLMLETATDNHTAQRLNERLGWKRDEEFYRYFLAV